MGIFSTAAGNRSLPVTPLSLRSFSCFKANLTCRSLISFIFVLSMDMKKKRIFFLIFASLLYIWIMLPCPCSVFTSSRDFFQLLWHHSLFWADRHLCQRSFCPILQRTLASAPATFEPHSSLPFPLCQGSPSIVWRDGLKASHYHFMIIVKSNFFYPKIIRYLSAISSYHLEKLLWNAHFLKGFDKTLLFLCIRVLQNHAGLH